VVIANAAINEPQCSGPIAEVDPNDVNKHLNVNVGDGFLSAEQR
jgi:hypothetical protein